MCWPINLWKLITLAMHSSGRGVCFWLVQWGQFAGRHFWWITWGAELYDRRRCSVSLSVVFFEGWGWIWLIFSYPELYEAQRVAQTGPLLLQDFHLVSKHFTIYANNAWFFGAMLQIESLAHFHRERIPERVRRSQYGEVNALNSHHRFRLYMLK